MLKNKLSIERGLLGEDRAKLPAVISTVELPVKARSNERKGR
jgi:hypothetical protein